MNTKRLIRIMNQPHGVVCDGGGDGGDGDDADDGVDDGGETAWGGSVKCKTFPDNSDGEEIMMTIIMTVTVVEVRECRKRYNDGVLRRRKRRWWRG